MLLVKTWPSFQLTLRPGHSVSKPFEPQQKYMITAVPRAFLMLVALCSACLAITPSDLLIHLPTQYFND
ncbi:MAG: hypothetical protein WBZ19_30140 [Chthoniobacterales bacterium]